MSEDAAEDQAERYEQPNIILGKAHHVRGSGKNCVVFHELFWWNFFILSIERFWGVKIHMTKQRAPTKLDVSGMKMNAALKNS